MGCLQPAKGGIPPVLCVCAVLCELLPITPAVCSRRWRTGIGVAHSVIMCWYISRRPGVRHVGYSPRAVLEGVEINHVSHVAFHC